MGEHDAKIWDLDTPVVLKFGMFLRHSPDPISKVLCSRSSLEADFEGISGSVL